MSARGRSQMVIDINTGGGCDEHSLDGEVTSTHGQKEEIDFGYYDLQLSMIGFRVMHSYPNGKRLNTLFIGKISGDKLVGTFVDDDAVTGRWTSVREK